MSEKTLVLANLLLALSLGNVSSALASSGVTHDECTCRDVKHRHSRRNCPPSTRVPELSADAAGGSLALLVGGLVVLSGARRRKP